MAETVLQLTNLVKTFDGVPVLKGISLSVPRGEFVTLLGPSGCGKTTTLRIIAGLEQPDSGSVLLNGKDVTALDPEKRSVNTVFQNYALFPHMNIEKNIAYGLRIRGVPKDERRRRVTEMLEMVKLPGYEKRMPSQLSGGQRQRVAIARAMVLKPEILLLDEPLGALDLKLRQQMQLELKALQTQLGITFIYITHDQEEALNMSDRIAIMREGQFEQIGTPEEIYERPQTEFAARFIGEGVVLRGVVKCVDGDTCAISSPDGQFLATRYAPHGVRVGDEVSVSIHSERILFGAEQHDGFRLSARVMTHRYAGSTLKSELKLKSGQVVTALGMQSRASLPPEGGEVALHWERHNASIIPEGGGAREA